MQLAIKFSLWLPISESNQSRPVQLVDSAACCMCQLRFPVRVTSIETLLRTIHADILSEQKRQTELNIWTVDNQ